MGDVVDVKKLFSAATFGLAGKSLFDSPDKPKLKKAPDLDPADARAQAEAAAERRKRRSIGAFGVTDTFKTGPQGVALGETPTAKTSLLGGA